MPRAKVRNAPKRKKPPAEPEQVQTEDTPPQETGVKTMAAKAPSPMTWSVEFGANYPNFKTTHEVNFGPDEETEYTYYSNLASDLIAALIVKLGIEFSKYRETGDAGRLAQETEKMTKALSGNILEQ